MSCKIRRLDWDSDFFGFETWRVDCGNIAFEAIGDVIAKLHKCNARLVYVFIPFGFQKVCDIWINAGATHVDTKVVYAGVPKERTSDELKSVRTFAPDEPITEDLRALALLSGKQSRYNRDPKMPSSIFTQLYETWIRRSVARQVASEVFVVENNDKIAGFVTVDFKDYDAIIGLIAVNPEVQGAGLGTRLLNAVEESGRGRSVKQILVATQRENMVACRFYERSGYKVRTEHKVLHLWI